MTVAELRRKLDDFPPDAEVVYYQVYSDNDIEVDDVDVLYDGTVRIS